MKDLEPYEPTDGLELDPDPKPLKTVTITINELPGQRLNMVSTPTFHELCATIKSGEDLVGADALAYHTLAYIIDKVSPKKPLNKELFIPNSRLIT